MHFPTRAFVSESQRELFVAGLGSEFEERGEVVERNRRRETGEVRGVLSEENRGAKSDFHFDCRWEIWEAIAGAIENTKGESSNVDVNR